MRESFEVLELFYSSSMVSLSMVVRWIYMYVNKISAFYVLYCPFIISQ